MLTNKWAELVVSWVMESLKFRNSFMILRKVGRDYDRIYNRQSSTSIGKVCCGLSVIKDIVFVYLKESLEIGSTIFLRVPSIFLFGITRRQHSSAPF